MRYLFGLFPLMVLLTACPNPEQGNASTDLLSKAKDGATINVGYIPYPPSLAIDPNTKEISGISYRIVTEVAKRTGLKMEYSAQVDWSNMIPSVEAGRVDLLGTCVWPTAERAVHLDFSTPLYYSLVNAYCRTNDDRFNGNLASLNDPGVRIAVSQGEMSQIVSQADYPRATQVEFAQLNSVADLLGALAENKADITFLEPAVAYEYMKAHPGVVKAVSNTPPVRTFPNVIAIKKGNQSFLNTLNGALTDLIANRYVESVLQGYEPDSSTVFFGRVNLQ